MKCTIFIIHCFFKMNHRFRFLFIPIQILSWANICWRIHPTKAGSLRIEMWLMYHLRFLLFNWILRVIRTGTWSFLLFITVWIKSLIRGNKRCNCYSILFLRFYFILSRTWSWLVIFIFFYFSISPLQSIFFN